MYRCVANRDDLDAVIHLGDYIYEFANGVYGDGSEFRLGSNVYPFRMKGVRVNGEWLHLNNCPVGYTAVPYPVGGNGNVFHFNLELNF